jgi:hypothetical protein
MEKTKSHYSTVLKISVLILIMLIHNNALNALDPSSENNWHFLAEPYIMFPSLSGTTGLRNLPDVKLDANPGDIFSHLQVGFMLNLEAHKENWAIASDLFFANLQQDITPTAIIISGQSKAKQYQWEFAGFYRIVSFLEIGLGGRLNNIYSGIDIVRNDIGEGNTGQSANISSTWIDPIIIARASTEINEKWHFQFRGDIGGFHIGSMLTWQLQGFAGYRFGKLFQLSAGYRINSIDYDKGSGQERFRYDVRMFGPIIKFGFNF